MLNLEVDMQPDPSSLLENIGLDVPLVGFYDAPDAGAFEPLVRPAPGGRRCVFAFYENWLHGETLQLTKDNYGCGGAGHWLCDVQTRDRDGFVSFLVDDEGLKASHELMSQWLDKQHGYQQEHPNLLIGPLREDQYAYLKTVTFYAKPDQLSALMLGAQYHSAPGDRPPVVAPLLARRTPQCASICRPTPWRLRSRSGCSNNCARWTRRAFSTNRSGGI
jgi:hypothetical protein